MIIAKIKIATRISSKVKPEPNLFGLILGPFLERAGFRKRPVRVTLMGRVRSDRILECRGVHTVDFLKFLLPESHIGSEVIRKFGFIKSHTDINLF